MNGYDAAYTLIACVAIFFLIVIDKKNDKS